MSKKKNLFGLSEREHTSICSIIIFVCVREEKKYWRTNTKRTKKIRCDIGY